MESFSSMDEPFPTPPPYFLPDDGKTQDVKVYQIVSPCTPAVLPASFSFSPGNGCSTQTQSPPAASAAPSNAQEPKFVTFETGLYRSPALTTCISCQAQVTTQVTFRVGTHAWLMCLVFVLCGLLLGCCLIPFFVNHFKDAYHTCPRCERVLHVERKTCCQ
ncbi:cell death-inducing p53-target protein 1-like [Stegastes partitus]|uniref:Cell death-inducing p53-target protein 1-like n=1 Tax=Stegastes partitus TaxID=144197 RepID=A0A9Y4TVV1_9TELE|nr:PREDICTED: cell death-inducing p53-target protein 1-like [Stegastes partitus]